MAVPKRKTSVSKRNMRRSHDSIKNINVVLDKDSRNQDYLIRLIFLLVCIRVEKFSKEIKRKTK